MSYKIDYNNYYTQITAIEEIINFKAEWEHGDKIGEYKKSYFCDTNKIIHSSLKSALSCKECFSEEEHMQYEAQQKLKRILNKY